MPQKRAPVDPEKVLDDIEIRNSLTRNLGVTLISELDQVMTRRGTNRTLARFCFIRTVLHIFDNLIDEVGACNEEQISERDTRIEKMESSITKLLAQLRETKKALAATREELEKVQKELEKCHETASTPKST